MSYILMEESAFRRLMKRITDDQGVDVRYDLTETDYWMNGKEVCDYLQISQALLNSYRRSHLLFHCKIKELYHYKRAEVYKLKNQMDKELVESGSLLSECFFIDNEEQAYAVFKVNNKEIPVKDQEI